MLTKLNEINPVFTAPLSVFNLIQDKFPKTLAECVTEALKGETKTGKKWSAATYIPSWRVLEIMREQGEALPEGPLTIDSPSVSMAAILGWIQTCHTYEIDPQIYLGIINVGSVNRPLPIDTLRAMPAYGMGFSTPSLRRSGEDPVRYLMTIAYLDEIVTGSGKMIPELVMMSMYNKVGDGLVTVKHYRTPLSAGLSYHDVAERMLKGPRAAPMRRAMFMSKGKAERDEVLFAEALEVSVLGSLLASICKEVPMPTGGRLKILPDARGFYTWSNPSSSLLTP